MFVHPAVIVSYPLASSFKPLSKISAILMGFTDGDVSRSRKCPLTSSTEYSYNGPAVCLCIEHSDLIISAGEIDGLSA